MPGAKSSRRWGDGYSCLCEIYGRPAAGPGMGIRYQAAAAASGLATLCRALGWVQKGCNLTAERMQIGCKKAAKRVQTGCKNTGARPVPYQLRPLKIYN
jgi:hypothetical protein